MDGDNSLRLTDREIALCFSDPAVASKFPPILTIEQAAELLQVPIGTVRDWRSRGLLRNSSRRVGRHVRFFRDRLMQTAFNTGLDK